MRAVLQRVTDASVTIDGVVTGKIDAGLLVFVCAMPADTLATAQDLAAKIAKLRLFKDKEGKTWQSRSTCILSRPCGGSIFQPKPVSSVQKCRSVPRTRVRAPSGSIRNISEFQMAPDPRGFGGRQPPFCPMALETPLWTCKAASTNTAERSSIRYAVPHLPACRA